VDLSHAKGQQVVPEGMMLAAPSSYDLRTVTNKLPPVRNQGSCGDCWTFATYGSLESWLRPAETTWDFAEMDLNCSHGYDWSPCIGGNRDMATAFLSRWEGPVLETCYPHGTTCAGSRPNCTKQKRVLDVIYLPDRASSSDNENLKNAVMNYGAVYTTMYWGDPYYRAANTAYYYAGGSTGNHSVCIVGWDDNYDRTRFNSPNPPANGAFIIRNSWGSGWGAGGYFYISYYDSRIGIENGVFMNAQSTTNYTRLYQYDPYGWISGFGYSGTSTAWAANIFTAIASEHVRAVAFYTPAFYSAYQIYVYTGCSAGSPRSGTLACNRSGTFANMGYHTLTLPSPAAVTGGQRFSIVLRLETPGYDYPIMTEGPWPGYCSAASANPGESYVSFAGTSWNDLTSFYPEDNVCLKALVGPSDPDGDGVYGTDDQCPNSIPGATVDATGCSNGPGDLDHDGDVDADDLLVFVICASGPEMQFSVGCQDANLDTDIDVDSIDFAVFQRCLSGANQPSDPACAN
jgi:C1A family cysteine protease